MDKSNANILIVDDFPSIRETLKGFLLRDGYQFFFAANGIEALKLVDTCSPDVILLDVMMPEMDGFEVCQKLKASKDWSHIPVILITALDSKEDMVRGFDAGADDFLSKPINSHELRARVRSMLRIKRQFDALEATLQLREDMAAMIVHDMRNPITPILGTCELLLLGQDLTPQQQKDINTIKTQTSRLNSFLNDMLMLTKMEQDELLINRSTVYPNQLVLSVIEAYQDIAKSRGLQIIPELPQRPENVWLDANLFRRVLDNLLSNAVKFSPKNHKVTVAVEHPDETDPTNNQLQFRLKVIDEGAGIPQAHKESIFDKFSIIDLKKEHIPQIGLGLAFCKMVVEAHNGTIFVKDNIPQGSVFIVEIPKPYRPN